jgi:hypothetical protein
MSFAPMLKNIKNKMEIEVSKAISPETIEINDEIVAC